MHERGADPGLAAEALVTGGRLRPLARAQQLERNRLPRGKLPGPVASSSAALRLAIELGDMEAAKERLRSLRDERERTEAELAQTSAVLPSVDELMPRLRAKLADLERTLRADVAKGRLALGRRSALVACASTATAGSRASRASPPSSSQSRRPGRSW